MSRHSSSGSEAGTGQLIGWGAFAPESPPREASVASPRASPGTSSRASPRVSPRASGSALSPGAQSPISWPSTESTGAVREVRRKSERETIVESIVREGARHQRQRLSYHVRRRRTQLLEAMRTATSRRPPRGRPCYFTEGHVEDEEGRDVNNEPSPYWVPPPEQELCYKKVLDQWRREATEKEARAPYYQHYNSRTRHNLDLLPRLHLPRDVEDPAKKTPGILDIDPDFFSLVEGRPENAATLGRLDMRKYLDDMREVLFTKLMIGYADDHCLLVEEQYSQELKVIKRIQDQHQKHVKAFEAFLAEDHLKSMEILQRADAMTAESQRMETELRTLNRSLGRLRNEVVILEDKWRSVKNLQRFLYAASPRAWRLIHDYEFIKRKWETGSASSVEEEGNTIKAKQVRSDMSLTELIHMFDEEVDNQPSPELYFKSPQDLLDVFENITHLNMDMMLHSEQVRKPLDELYHTLQDARKMVEQDTEKLRTTLKAKKERIEWEEKRAAGLEADARRVLDEFFKDIIINDNIIRIYVCVEDAYEIVVGPTDNNLTIVEMMQEIERAFENLYDELDGMPPTVLAAVQDDVALDEKIGFVKAKVAAKQLEHIHRLEMRMHNLLQSPPRPGMRPLVFRSPPFVRFVAKHKKECKLTEAEKNMLLHLTEYCVYKDDPDDFVGQLQETGMMEPRLSDS